MRRADAAVLAQARSLIDWHDRHGYCANCGSPTEPREAGYMRACTECRAQHFPRTDPVTIMLVLRGDKLLLGRQPRFAPMTFSALAGFVEQGENIEEAVRREVREEVGIRVGEVRYHSSQPWPFPSSLMIGCMAEAEEETIRLDPDELEDARWFSRAEIAEMVENHKAEGKLRMPPPISIAHQLAKAWLRGE
jgi:NAD+ diphosphatase